MSKLPPIDKVYERLSNGIEPKNGRCRAFWRNSMDYNISLDVSYGGWCDHAYGEHEVFGGNVVGLIRISKHWGEEDAYSWLSREFGYFRYQEKKEKSYITYEQFIYNYTDVNENVLFEVVRRDYSNGEKSIRVRHKDAYGKYDWKIPPLLEKCPLYNLSEVLKKRRLPVLIVEGEKVAEFLKSRLERYAVTTWQGGSGAKIEKMDWKVLIGRTVHLFPDNDEPGRKVMNKIAERLKKEGIDIIFMWPTYLTHTGEDAYDILKNNTSIECDNWIDRNCRHLVYSKLVYNKEGYIIKHPLNIKSMINELGIKLYHNKLTAKSEIYNLYEGGDNLLTKEKISSIRMLLSDRYEILLKKTDIEDVAVDMAALNAYEPILYYFGNLKKWDGVERIKDFFADFFDLDRTKYLEAVALLFFIALVKRAHQPGCHMDKLIVFSGMEGVGKTSLMENLLPINSWFNSMSVRRVMDINRRTEETRRCYIVEISEYNPNEKEDDEIRSFISGKAQPMRAAYGHDVEQNEKRFIVYATTNEPNFLTPGRGRRIIPVRIYKLEADEDWVKAKIMNIREIRDALWSEALHYYKSNPDVELSLSKDVVDMWNTEKALVAHDMPYVREIVKYLDNYPDLVKVKPHIIYEMIMPEEFKWKINKHELRKINNALIILGFQPHRSAKERTMIIPNGLTWAKLKELRMGILNL